MAAIITLDELATWTRRTIAPDDEYALMVIAEASGLICDTAGVPGWETGAVTPVPRVARRIALQVAARTFTNPEFEVQYGIGPLSGRILDLGAMGLNLTEYELNALQNLAVSGGSASGFWIQPTDGGVAADLSTIFVDDPWGLEPIPYLDENELDAMTPLEP